MPQSAASHPHGGGASHQQVGAEPAGIVGIALRVAQVVHGGPPFEHGAAGEGAKAPSLRPALVGRRTPAASTAVAMPIRVYHRLTPTAPHAPATSTDPAMLRDCCRHLSMLLHGTRTGGDSLLLDTLEVAQALRLGVRSPPVLMGPLQPSSAASAPFLLPIEGTRTANSESWRTESCHGRGEVRSGHRPFQQ